MRHHFEFDLENKILLLVVDGDLRDGDINAVDAGIRRHVRDLNPVAGITDLSGVTSFDVSSDGIWLAALEPSPYKDLKPCYIVAPGALVSGLSGMFEIAAGRETLSVVRSREEAFQGLNIRNPRFERLGDSDCKYRVLRLGQEEFGIRIEDVIVSMSIQDIAPLPQMRPEIRGVVHYHGKSVPVLDPRLRFGLPEEKYTPRTCVVVVEVRLATGPMLVGILSDGCGELLDPAAVDTGRMLTTTDLTEMETGMYAEAI